MTCSKVRIGPEGIRLTQGDLSGSAASPDQAGGLGDIGAAIKGFHDAVARMRSLSQQQRDQLAETERTARQQSQLIDEFNGKFVGVIER
jgi:hypothetical protein